MRNYFQYGKLFFLLTAVDVSVFLISERFCGNYFNVYPIPDFLATFPVDEGIKVRYLFVMFFIRISSTKFNLPSIFVYC